MDKGGWETRIWEGWKGIKVMLPLLEGSSKFNKDQEAIL